MKAISKLQFITTNSIIAEHACRCGVDWVQLRLKNVYYTTFFTIAIEVQAICKKYNAKLIINDNVALAKEIGADGVHLGKEDMAAEKAREILGDSFLIGCSANTFEDIVLLSSKPIDYIGLGPFRFTDTKQNLSPVLGLQGYKNIFQDLINNNIKTPPIIAIGGIKETDVAQILNTGIWGIAVSGAIANATDIEKAANGFLKELFT